MATKPLTNEAIAITEKKMDMALDDIIKMSKKNIPSARKTRPWNKNEKFMNNGVARGNSSNMHKFADSRSSVRQGVLAQRRSKFQNNQFHETTAVARKAAVAPVRSWPVNHNRVVNWNKQRIGVSPVQRQIEEGRFSSKMQHQQHQPPKIVSRQGTLDSLFANMKQQRMRALSQQQNNNNSWRMERGDQQQRGGQQQHGGRGRGRFGYMANRSFRPRPGYV